MKYALVIVETTGDIDKTALALRNFARNITECLEKNPSICALNVGAYLIPIELDANALGELLHNIRESSAPQIHNVQFLSRTIYLDDAPSWYIPPNK